MRLSLKIALMLLILGLFPLLILGLHTMTRTAGSLARSTEQALLALGGQAGKEIGRVVTEGNNALLLLAQTPLLTDPDSEKADIERFMYTTKRFHPVVRDMTLLDAQGRVRASTSYSFHGNWRETEWFKASIQGQRLFSGVHVLLYPARTAMTTSSPVVDQDGGDIIGVLVGRLDLAPLTEILADVDLGPGGKAFLVDEHGLLVAAPNMDATLEPLPYSGILEALKRKKRGTALVEDGEMLAVYQPLPQSPDATPLAWSIVLLQRTEAARAPVRNLRTSVAVAIGISLLGITVLSLTVSRRLGRRFSALTTATRRIGNGDFNIDLQDPVDDEIGEMAAALSDTAAQLARSHEIIETYQNDLEEMVGQRTRQLKEAKEDADKANRAKDDFLASMSHEIRTPLTAVIGLAEELQYSELSEEQHAHIQVIMDAAEHLLSMVNDVLDASRIEAGEMTLQSVEFELDKLLGDLMRAFDFQARSRELELSLLLSAEVPLSLRGDPTRLRQILYNLLGNALKFTPQGAITLEVEPSAPVGGRPAVTFTVIDTGIGVPEDKMEEIFQPYRQASEGDGAKSEGTGLGLPICQHLAGLMGGRITAESEPDAGSRFSFTAIFQEADHTESTSLLRLKTPARGKSLRVLVAEDNRVNQRLVKRYLERLSHQPVIAKDGTEALHLLEHEDFDVVLMDVEMPGLDGPETTKRLRRGEAGERNRSIPVLALTAHPLSNVRGRIDEAGMDGFLEKPLKIRQLAKALDSFPSPDASKADAVPVAEPFVPLKAMARLGAGEEEFRRIAAQGVRDMEEQIAQSRSALRDGDMRLLTDCARSLGDVCSRMGADECRSLARLLEGAARLSKSVSAEAHLLRLREALKEIRNALARAGFLP